MNMFCRPEKPVAQLQHCGLQLKVLRELAICVMVFQGLGPAFAEDSVCNPLVAICPCNSCAWQDLPEIAEFSVVLELSRTPFAELGMQRCRLMLNVARP